MRSEDYDDNNNAIESSAPQRTKNLLGPSTYPDVTPVQLENTSSNRKLDLIGSDGSGDIYC